MPGLTLISIVALLAMTIRVASAERVATAFVEQLGGPPIQLVDQDGDAMMNPPNRSDVPDFHALCNERYRIQRLLVRKFIGKRLVKLGIEGLTEDRRKRVEDLIEEMFKDPNLDPSAVAAEPEPESSVEDLVSQWLDLDDQIRELERDKKGC